MIKVTLPFDKTIVNDGEIIPHDFKNPNFVGFLNPVGTSIDYSMPFGLGGHDSNYTTDLFKEFFYTRFREYDEGNEAYEKNERDICASDLKKILKKLNDVNEKIESNRNWLNKVSEFDLMDRDLLIFFRNCYSNGLFNKGLGKDVRFMDEFEFSATDFKPVRAERERLYPMKENETRYEYNYRIPYYLKFEAQYSHYINTMLLDLLKETFICYLGYHSVERIPRTITTSEFNIYETFYNYLLNDFNIVRLPKMIYSVDEKMYKEYKPNEFLVSEKELILKDEIESIKRMVPPNKRYKYYR